MDKTLKIALLLTAIDHMSEKVSGAVEKSRKKLKLLNGLNSFGSLALTGATAGIEFLEKTVSAAEENEVAQRRLSQVFSHSIKNYNEATEASEKYANSLGLQIGQEHEAVMGVQAKLGIFKRVATEANLQNGLFNRATKAAFDMQAAGIGEASMNIMKIGKVLDNPIKSINALSKAGIIFTKGEQAKILALIKSHKLFEAQDLILKKVEGRVGGVAAKTAPATAKMRVAWNEVTESLGKHLLPTLNKFATYLATSVIPKVQEFIEKHPKLIKYLAAGVAGLLALGVAAKILSGAMLILDIVSGPVALTILAIGALAFVLVKYWKPISGFFVKIWNGLKNGFASVLGFFKRIWNGIKAAFSIGVKTIGFIVNPFSFANLIVKHWAGISTWFTNLWNGVKNIFNNVMKWFASLGTKFFEAGKNIIMSIGRGIKSAIMWPINQVKGMVQKIRNLLPFSPAKEGPLRDIHKIKLVETIAASINSNPLIKAMKGVVTDVTGFGGNPRPQAVASTVNGGAFHLNYSPTINGGSKADIAAELKKHSKELIAMIGEEMRKRERTKF